MAGGRSSLGPKGFLTEEEAKELQDMMKEMNQKGEAF